MQEDKPPIWSLEIHLNEGLKAIAAIQNTDGDREPKPICHHFSERDPIDVWSGSREKTYGYMLSIFADASVSFAADRLECWETAHPDKAWLSERIPSIYRIADDHALIYEGWTWEPRHRQPIGACTFQVINNRSR